MPSWLELHPGAQPQTNPSPGMLETSYTIAGKPAEAVEHFKPLFAKANLKFHPNADGIGLVARVDAQECDLMMQFHPNPAGTTLRIYCTAKSAPANEFYIPPTQSSGLRSQGRLSQRVPTQRIWNETLPSTVQAQPTQAPMLAWPDWLGLLGTRARPTAENTRISGMSCLRKHYLVDPVQRRPIINGYRDLLVSQGFTVDMLKFSTGNTITGKVVEDFKGSVSGFQSLDGTLGTAATVVKAAFSRGSTISDPGHVYVSVCVQGGSR